MRPRHWWIAAALVTFLGCNSSNPNEADFPGATGSRVPAPKPAPAGAGGGAMAKGGAGGLPSSYPGIEKLRQDTQKKSGEAPRPAEAARPPASDEAKPPTPGDEAKPAAPK